VGPPAPAPADPVTITGLPADAPFIRAMHEACSPRGVSVRVVTDQGPPSIQVARLTLGPIDRAAALSKLQSAGIALSPTTTAGVRAFSLFGDQSLLWLSPDIHRNEPIAWADARARQLLPAFELTARVRRATGLECFALDLAVLPGQLTPVALAEDDAWTDAAPLFTWFCERVADRATRPNSPAAGHGVWLSPATPATTARTKGAVAFKSLISAA
jgi:hypothetical protein